MIETAGSGSPVNIAGIPTAWEWLGTHTYRIKCNNGGSSNIALNSGDPLTGFYESVYSNEFDVTIIDPCLRSIVNFD